MDTEPFTLSFVMPVRNASGTLGRCLESIRAAAGPGAEIIVIDNGSVDDSARIAADHGARVLVEPGLRVGALRNVGVRSSSGEVIAFVDADHEIAPGWVGACRAALQPAKTGAAGRLCDAPAAGSWVQRAYECLRDRPGSVVDVEWLGAGNLAVLRAAFEEVGGFDESLEACEDVDLCRRIRQHGWRIVSVPGMGSVHHGDPATLGAVFRGELWRGRDNVRVSLRERLTLRSTPGLVLPVAVLCLIAGTALAAVLAHRIGPWPAVAGLGGLVGIVLLRALVMIRRGRASGVRRMFECAAVAAAYEAGRALALVARTSHGTRRRGVTAHA